MGNADRIARRHPKRPYSDKVRLAGKDVHHLRARDTRHQLHRHGGDILGRIGGQIIPRAIGIKHPDQQRARGNKGNLIHLLIQAHRTLNLQTICAPCTASKAVGRWSRLRPHNDRPETKLQSRLRFQRDVIAQGLVFFDRFGVAATRFKRTAFFQDGNFHGTTKMTEVRNRDELVNLPHLGSCEEAI